MNFRFNLPCFYLTRVLWVVTIGALVGSITASNSYARPLSDDRIGNNTVGSPCYGVGVRGVFYLVHVQDEGWHSDIYCNRGDAVSTRSGRRLEAIRIWSTKQAVICYRVYFRGHWQDGENARRCLGGMAGTVGQSQQIEGIAITMSDRSEICYQVRIAGQWQDQRCDGEFAGNAGSRIDGIRIWFPY